MSTVDCRVLEEFDHHHFGPFKIKKKLSSVAYQMDLPEGSKILHTFHIEKLKKFKGEARATQSIHTIMAINNQPICYPLAIIDCRKIYFKGKFRKQLLVHRSNGLPEDATWEDVDSLKQAFPSIQVENNLGSRRG